MSYEYEFKIGDKVRAFDICVGCSGEVVDGEIVPAATMFALREAATECQKIAPSIVHQGSTWPSILRDLAREVKRLRGVAEGALMDPERLSLARMKDLTAAETACNEMRAELAAAAERFEVQARTACEATERAELLDKRLADEQAKTAALETRAQQLEAELTARTKLLGEWCADWQQEPKTRLAHATMQAMRGRG